MSSRYSRNISLFGHDGQGVLLDSKVLVIGAGGLGSPLLYYLAAAGVGTIGVIDHDKVALSDLQRQILYNSEMINRNKAFAARGVLNKLNPDCEIIAYNSGLNEENCDIIDDYDVIAECSDNFKTKFLVNRECYLRRKPLVLAAVIGYKGYVGTFKPYLDLDYPCYQCFCPEIPKRREVFQSCETQGVLNSVVGTVGSVQTTKVIKELLQIDTEEPNKLVRITLDTFSVSVICLDSECLTCLYVKKRNIKC